jgi:hypothetical protein
MGFYKIFKVSNIDSGGRILKSTDGNTFSVVYNVGNSVQELILRFPEQMPTKFTPYAGSEQYY